MPDPARFRERIGGLIAQHRVRRPGWRVRLFDEMGDVLWRERTDRCALAVEALWDTLIEQERLTMLCGYSLGTFATRHRELHAACDAHSHVLPPESGMPVGIDDDPWVALNARAEELEALPAGSKEWRELALKALKAIVTVERRVVAIQRSMLDLGGSIEERSHRADVFRHATRTVERLRELQHMIDSRLREAEATERQRS